MRLRFWELKKKMMNSYQNSIPISSALGFSLHIIYFPRNEFERYKSSKLRICFFLFSTQELTNKRQREIEMNPEKVCEFWADIIAKNSMQKKRKKEKRIYEERERERVCFQREKCSAAKGVSKRQNHFKAIGHP